MLKNKTLVTNFFSLSSLQLANYVLPLLTVPYIVRVIGPEKFGLINFAQAIVAYFMLVVNYGFDLTATRDISINRNNREIVEQIFSTIIIAKIYLFIICSFLFVPLIMFSPKLSLDFVLYIYSYLIIIGMILFPTWMFQGMEKLTNTAIFNFVIKILFTLSIFLFVKKSENYLFIPLISGIGQIVVGVLAYVYAIKKFSLKFKYPSIELVKNAYKEGWVVFSSTVVINLYTTSNVVILGLFVDNNSVGYFTAAVKIVTVMQGLILVPINQSFYPHIGKAFHESKEKGIMILKKLTIIVSLITLLGSLIILILAPTIISIVFGNKFIPSTNCLRLLSFLPFIIGLSNIFSIQGLLNLKKDKAFFYITFLGAIISIILNLLFVPIYHQEGTSISWLLTEIFITFTSFFVLFRSDINLIDLKYFKKYLLKGSNV